MEGMGGWMDHNIRRDNVYCLPIVKFLSPKMCGFEIGKMAQSTGVLIGHQKICLLGVKRPKFDCQIFKAVVCH